MYKVSFELETVTPLFMAGADGKTPERKLRPPSFKGILRFWWRAVQIEESLSLLAEKEADLFGGTGKHEGKSNVSIWFSMKSELTTGIEYMLPHRPSEQSRSAQQAIEIGQNFPCHLRFRQMKVKDQIIAAFQIALILGGFGKRSRRGFGSIADRSWDLQDVNDVIRKLTAMSQQLSVQIPLEFKDSNVIRTRLQRKINMKTPKYPRISEIHIGHTGYSDYHDLLLKIGKGTSNHRDKTLGNGSPRMASPIVVSVLKIGSNYHPIITKLSSHFKEPHPENYEKKQQAFIEEIVS